MKIDLQNLISEATTPRILYHGSGMEFDEFDASKSQSATEQAHHGYGTYLVDNEDTAREYVDNYALNGAGYIYSCRVLSDTTIESWDEMIPLDEFERMADELEDVDPDLSEEMKNYPEGYQGETFTYGELYSILKSVAGYENPNKFFKEFYIDGFYGSNRIHPNSVEYCIFDSKNIKIIGKEPIRS